MRVNKIEVMYGGSRVYVKVESCATFTLTRDLPHITFYLFYLRTYKLRDSGNPPEVCILFRFRVGILQ